MKVFSSHLRGEITQMSANFHKSGSADGYLIEVFVCVYEHNHMLSLVNEESSEKVMTQLRPFLMFFRFNCSLSLSTTL